MEQPDEVDLLAEDVGGLVLDEVDNDTKKEDEQTIKVQIEQISSTKILIKWEYSPKEDGCFYILGEKTPIHFHETWEKRKDLLCREMEYDHKAFTSYKIRVEFRNGDKVIATSATERVPPSFTKDALEKLMEMADPKMQMESMESIKFLHRTQNKDIWEKIEAKDNNIIKRRMKDFCGHASNPINENLYGIWFATNTYKRGLPTQSPYGDTLLVVPTDKILTDSTKLYFSDFYCFDQKDRKIHYITIVVCREGSEEDVFCGNNLLPLDKHNNPFLRFNTTNEEWEVPNTAQRSLLNGQQVNGRWISNDHWVEVFFTEEFQITDDCEFKSLENKNIGKGRSTPGGLVNKRTCTTCNFKPI